MRLWLAVLGMGLVTYATRLGPFLFLEGRRLPPGIVRALRLVPPAVLSALIVPDLLQPAGSLDLTPANLRLLAGVLAVLVAWRTRSVLATTAAGLGGLWALQVIVAG